MMNRTLNSVEVNNVTVKCGSFSLKNISLSIKKNEIFAVLGKTGSGKTVLLETISGFHRQYSGDIFLAGRKAEGLSLEERSIGYVYQDFGLFPHMNVFGNIAYGLKMHGVKKPEILQRVDLMAKTLSISHILKCFPETLSGGEKQRTALARALVLSPRLLLLDEPFSALDPETKKKMYAELSELHSRFGCTTIFVTHDFHEAESLADRVGILHNGELSAVVKSGELFSRKNSYTQEVINFLGIPPRPDKCVCI